MKFEFYIDFFVFLQFLNTTKMIKNKSKSNFISPYGAGSGNAPNALCSSVGHLLGDFFTILNTTNMEKLEQSKTKEFNQRVAERGYDFAALNEFLIQWYNPTDIGDCLEWIIDQLFILFTDERLIEAGCINEEWHDKLYLLKELKYCFRYMEKFNKKAELTKGELLEKIDTLESLISSNDELRRIYLQRRSVLSKNKHVHIGD